jgi:hypothetical protein
MDSFDEKQVADAAWEFLRSNSTATLIFGEHSNALSYVIAPTGELVIPAMVAMLQPCDVVMYVPEYCDNCIEMHVSLQQFLPTGEQGIFADRWNIYHGESPDVQWALVAIDMARFHEMFIDGESLCRKNPLVDIEASVRKELNVQRTKAVRKTCLAKTNVDVKDPVVVGVDPLGVDIRAPFGIVRIPASEPFRSVDDVLAVFA